MRRPVVSTAGWLVMIVLHAIATRVPLKTGLPPLKAGHRPVIYGGFLLRLTIRSSFTGILAVTALANMITAKAQQREAS